MRRASSQSTNGSGDLPIGVFIALSLVGVALLLSLFSRMNFPVNDFTGFWIGAKLLGSPYLYDIPANLALQKSMTGQTVDGLIYVRPPFFAAAIRTLTVLPYETAIQLWRLVLLTSLTAFVALFPLTRRRYTALAISWSLLVPLAIAIPNDVSVVLLILTLAICAWRNGRPILAGALLGLCLAKFHFLVFLPLVLFRTQYRRVLAGFSAVALGLVLVNFLVQPNWDPLYWKALNMPQQNMNWHPDSMPNFYSSFFRTGHSTAGVIVGALLVSALLWRICSSHRFEISLAFCILGGTLVSPHTNHIDTLLGLPALLAVAYRMPGIVRVIAAVLVSPAGAWLYLLGPPGIGPAIFVAGCLLVMWLVARKTDSAPTNI